MSGARSEIDDRLHWYKDAIIYEVHIKAFRDGNADGIGDFKGLIEKLDYLQDLGVTAIWVLPFYPSPQRDDGYDIADYFTINSNYGNLEDFKTFLDEAHGRNLKVITELVINHTSDQHPWFQRARRAPAGSSYRNYYVWTDDPTKYKDVRIIFQDFEASNWTWDSVAQQYYWHRFFHHQPDLNYDNPDVQQEVFRIIDYWASLGVDGFRLDAIPYLFEREGTNCENLPETHEFLKKLRTYMDEKYPGTLMLAEANMWPEDSASYFGDGDECHMNYHFPVMPRMYMALQMEDKYPITDIFDQTPEIPETCQWAIFLRNHDELTLEMVTDEERDYMYRVYVKDPMARINLGIRHRLSPLMGNNRKKIELLNYLLFSLPGTPVIYYGDEIGMGDNLYLGDRNGVRTPMQWSADRNAGFSESNPQKLYLPIILDPEYHYEFVNVDLQSKNTASLLWWMKRMIAKRKQYKALSRGTLTFIASENPKILSFLRTYLDETILVIVNLSRYPQPFELNLQSFAGYVPIEVFSRNKFPTIRNDVPYFLTLGSYESMWFVLQSVEASERGRQQLDRGIPKQWADGISKSFKEHLEDDILMPYMLKRRWFGGKGRTIESLDISRTAPLNTRTGIVYNLLIEVSYDSGLPDTYQLAIGLAEGELANEIQETYPNAVLASNEEALLFDAFFLPSFHLFVLEQMVAGNSNGKAGGIKFFAKDELQEYVNENHNIKSRILSGEQSNTSVLFDNKYFLKFFRKVDRSVNPDVEITRFLTVNTNFKCIPAYVGEVSWNFDHQPMVLAMLQEMIDNSTDAWVYFLDRLEDFYEKVLSGGNLKQSFPMPPSLVHPLSFDESPLEVKEMLDGTLAERTRLLGIRTAEMHLALATQTENTDFTPEPYSLHYQRSLFAGLQTLVRSTFDNLQKSLHKLPDPVKEEVKEVLDRRGEVLDVMKRIYHHKIDVVKIRIHGDFHLGQVLFTGKDFVITDFEGEPARAYSERRLKRSPLRDIAGMVRSLHYAAYGALFLDNQIRSEDIPNLMPYAETWFHYFSNFFMHAYLERLDGQSFIPAHRDDLEILMTTFLLEKAIYELNYEINNRPDWLVIPLRGVTSILNNIKDGQTVKPEYQTKL